MQNAENLNPAFALDDMHAKSILISPPDVAIEHFFPPYTAEKRHELAGWHEL
jgi:hypothetical protein